MSTGRIKAHRGRTGVAGHVGLGAASAREEGPQAKHRCGRPQWRAAAGGGARRGRVTYLDVGECTWATQALRRSPPPWTKAPCRGSISSVCRAAPKRQHGQRGAGGPRAGLAAAARAGGSRSQQQPTQRRGPRRPRGAAAAGGAAADRRADKAQEALPLSATPRSPTPAALDAALDASGALPAL